MMRGEGLLHRSRDALLDEAMGKAYDQRIMRRLLAQVRGYWSYMALSVLLAVITAATGLAGPYLIKIGIDQFIAARDTAGLDLIALLCLVITAANWGASYGQTYVMSWVGQNVLRNLRLQIFEHLQRLSLAFYDRNEVGRIMSRLQNDVNVLNDLLTTGLVGIFGDLLSLVGIVFLMFTMNAQLSLLSSSVVPLLILAAIFWQNRARDAYREVRGAISAVNAGLQENISGVRVVQSMVRESENLQRFGQMNNAHFEANVNAGRLAAGLLPAVDLLAAIATALVIAFGGAQVLAGQLSAGALVAFTLYIGRFFDPIRDLSQRYNLMQSGMASGERIFELLDTEPAIVDTPDAVEVPAIAGEVHFEKVSFFYEPGQEVLHEVSFTAHPGETVALVGPTGAGKSTIVNLIGRYYEVRQGAIRVDGRDLRQIKVRSLRKQIGMVLQDSFLFAGTIRENVMYGNPEATPEQMVAAARAVGIDAVIQRMDKGYETEVQERGGRLSLGQRQLITFARALLADPRILILDEATSSVDAETEAAIQTALKVLLQGRTAFVIAHRLSTIRNADRILVIDRGSIVEEGRHAHLLASEGLYSQLYHKGLLGIADIEPEESTSLRSVFAES